MGEPVAKWCVRLLSGRKRSLIVLDERSLCQLLERQQEYRHDEPGDRDWYASFSALLQTHLTTTPHSLRDRHTRFLHHRRRSHLRRPPPPLPQPRCPVSPRPFRSFRRCRQRRVRQHWVDAVEGDSGRWALPAFESEGKRADPPDAGIDVYAPEDPLTGRVSKEILGKSSKAGELAIAQTAASRVLTNMYVPSRFSTARTELILLQSHTHSPAPHYHAPRAPRCLQRTSRKAVVNDHEPRSASPSSLSCKADRIDDRTYRGFAPRLPPPCYRCVPAASVD